MSFLSLERITGRYIAEKIMEFLKDNDLPVENIHRQGYDGASNMSSERIGVQAQIREVSPCNVYPLQFPSIKSIQVIHVP